MVAQGNGAHAVRGLGERWIRELAGSGGDFVCSPAGLWLALTALAAGARGATADELRAVLGVAGDEAAGAATATARALAATDGLGVATRVWTRTPVHRRLRRALPDIGFGPMDPDEVDAWVRKTTGGLIERLPVAVNDQMLLVLVNALALKTDWAIPFTREATRDRPFTDAAGVTREVPTMFGKPPSWDVWMTGGAFVLDLRCARRGPDGPPPVKVRLVLGRPGEGAAEVLPAAWAPKEARTALHADVVTIAVPRFTLRTHIRATDQLPALGVRLASTPAADFSGLSATPLMLSEAVQEAVLKVTEEGLSAAAVTVLPAPAGAEPGPPPRRLHLAFDRPFGIVVLDPGEEVPLFAGWQAETPSDTAD
ncbi:serpin family protein [Streptomyces drozdowiczii]|uniref:Serpin family protein n=1 Tax=Streptomyces drozdowiczii TaxID=202862 RepID=A0ABY6PX22_9ACTN|nr:serpin family protein [Streptomyces drozdowiczii]MCX0243641.1 serpin family protein [Streptomyces drozdowiczii]UZK56468.1 serpin family protein [Streptomyces drozdowiczii]